MAKNNLKYFDGIGVKKNRNNKSYKVIFKDEECTISINAKEVQEICESGNVEELVAILLAYVEYIRKDTSTDEVRLRKIEVIEPTIKLLRDYDVESLIFYFRSLKWHEIKSIYESADPGARFKEIID